MEVDDLLDLSPEASLMNEDVFPPVQVGVDLPNRHEVRVCDSD